MQFATCYQCILSLRGMGDPHVMKLICLLLANQAAQDIWQPWSPNKIQPPLLIALAILGNHSAGRPRDLSPSRLLRTVAPTGYGVPVNVILRSLIMIHYHIPLLSRLHATEYRDCLTYRPLTVEFPSGSNRPPPIYLITKLT